MNDASESGSRPTPPDNERFDWNHPYVYTSNGADEYSIESYGKDGVDGANISYATRWQFDLDIVASNGNFTASPEQ